MEIRRLNEKDLNEWFACRLRALESDPLSFAITLEEEKVRGVEHFTKSFSSDSVDTISFGAYLQNHIVGIVTVARNPRLKVQHVATIYGMYVDEDQRLKGLGGKLLDVAIQFAKDSMEATVVTLEVVSINGSAQKLYLSRGFRKCGTLPKSMLFEDKYYDSDYMLLEV